MRREPGRDGLSPAAALSPGAPRRRRAERRAYPLASRLGSEAFRSRVSEALVRAANGDVAVLVVDAKRFKSFNAAFGRAAGDRLLAELGCVLGRFCAPGGACTREGSEFLCLLRWEGEDEFARRFAKIDEDLDALPVLGELGHRIRVRGGVAVCGEGSAARSAADLLDCARYACECAEDLPCSTFSLYRPEMKERDVARCALQSAAVSALESGEFVAYYQPKVVVGTGAVAGLEALVRWAVPGGGVLPPSEFVEDLESNGFIAKIDRSVFRQACAFLSARISEGLPVVPVACNFSRVDLRDESFASYLTETAAEFGVPCELLELELTESVAMGDLAHAVEVSRRFKECGFRLAIDDFGSGYSSLGVLQRLSVDTLKIDRSLLVSSESSEYSMIILESVASMAERLGVQVVVEGVETSEQASMLGALDPGLVVQGYLYSQPAPPEKAAEWMDAGTVGPRRG